MAINKAAFDQLKQEKENLLPTPPIGLQVNWFDRNQNDRCYAAMVTGQQGPGKLELAVFKPRSMPMHKQGVLHRSHPVHQRRSDSATIRCGAWDYLPNVKAHRSHFEIHLNEIERRENHLIESERISQDAKKARDVIRDENIEEPATS